MHQSNRFYFRNSTGAVLFEHGRHTEYVESCADCHHDALSADERIACSDCHGDDVEAGDFTHSEYTEIGFHSCTTCHATQSDAEPRSCRSCHPGEPQGVTITNSCADCHDDSYTPDLMTHDEMLEIEGHSCDACHTPAAVKDVYHQQCTGCHVKENEPKFVSGGEVKCQTCHLK